MERTAKTKQDVSFFAPVIGEIVWCVFDHPDAYRPELSRSPKRLAGGASMLCGHNVGPVGGAKRNVVYFHKSLNFPRFAPIVKGYSLFWRVTHSHTHGI